MFVHVFLREMTDEGDKPLVDNQNHPSNNEKEDTIARAIAKHFDVPISAKESGSRGKPLLLLVCATGITSCYMWYGRTQELVFHMDREEGRERITLFLLATGTLSLFLLAWAWTIVGPILLSKKSHCNAVIVGTTRETTRVVIDGADGTGSLDHPLIVLTSITYLLAISASNESLHYVSYPTCVLAKSL